MSRKNAAERTRDPSWYTHGVDEYIYHRKAIEPELFDNPKVCKALALAILDQAGATLETQHRVREAMEW